MSTSNTWQELEGLGYAQQGAEKLVKKIYNSAIIPNEVRFDLHGMTANQAHAEIPVMFQHAKASNSKCMLFIHGIGQGVLKDLIWDFSISHPELLACIKAPNRLGGDGATILVFKRKSNDN